VEFVYDCMLRTFSVAVLVIVIIVSILSSNMRSVSAFMLRTPVRALAAFGVPKTAASSGSAGPFTRNSGLLLSATRNFARTAAGNRPSRSEPRGGRESSSPAESRNPISKSSARTRPNTQTDADEIEISNYERRYIDKYYSDSDSAASSSSSWMFDFKVNDKVDVEIKRFTPLGASVNIYPAEFAEKKVFDYKIGEIIMPPEESIPKGLVANDELELARERLQRDIKLGERMIGYIGQIKLDDDLDKRTQGPPRISVLLRPVGAHRIQSTKDVILQALEAAPRKTIPVGDRSSTEAVGELFPGITKKDFKMAIGALYREGLVIPSKESIVRTTPEQQQEIVTNRTKKALERKVETRVTTLFIGNLPKEITKEALQDHVEFALINKLSKLSVNNDPATAPFAQGDVTIKSIRVPTGRDIGFVDIQLKNKPADALSPSQQPAAKELDHGAVVNIVVDAIRECKMSSKKLSCHVSTGNRDKEAERKEGDYGEDRTNGNDKTKSPRPKKPQGKFSGQRASV
jgi:hypothetical protein